MAKVLLGLSIAFAIIGLILLIAGAMMYFSSEKARKALDDPEGTCPKDFPPSNNVSNQCKVAVNGFPTAAGRALFGTIFLLAAAGVGYAAMKGVGKKASPAGEAVEGKGEDDIFDEADFDPSEV